MGMKRDLQDLSLFLCGAERCLRREQLVTLFLCIIIYCYSHLLYIIIMSITKVPKYIYELYFLSLSLYQNTNSMEVGEGGVLYPKCLKQFVTHSRQLLNTC